MYKSVLGMIILIRNHEFTYKKKRYVQTKKRPRKKKGGGFSIAEITSFIGKKCNKNLVKYDKLKKTDFD